AAGTRGALAECPGGSSGDGFAGLPGDARVVSRLGTGVALGGHPGKVHSLDSRRIRGFQEVPMCLGTRGHVACSEGSRRWLTVQALGDRCLFQKAPGGYVVLVSALRTGGELGSIRR